MESALRMQLSMERSHEKIVSPTSADYELVCSSSD